MCDLLRNAKVSESPNAKTSLENLVHNLVHTTVTNHHTQLESRHKWGRLHSANALWRRLTGRAESCK